MERHRSKILIICLLISVASVIYLWHLLSSYKNQPNLPKTVTYTPPPVSANTDNPVQVVSPDGKFKMIMKTLKNKENLTYTFIVFDQTSSLQKEIYSKTTNLDTKMSIPLNTFSPDDKFVFLKEESASGTSFIVLTASGADIAKDTKSYEIVSLFAAKHPNYVITDATGWGGMNLIVFNTDKVGGGEGPSFWFEVPSKAIIQLNDRFN